MRFASIMDLYAPSALSAVKEADESSDSSFSIRAQLSCSSMEIYDAPEPEAAPAQLVSAPLDQFIPRRLSRILEVDEASDTSFSVYSDISSRSMIAMHDDDYEEVSGEDEHMRVVTDFAANSPLLALENQLRSMFHWE
jgi:hypothetical protein